jgi:RNA polymerase sigma-70 factor (ECF subfamily)
LNLSNKKISDRQLVDLIVKKDTAACEYLYDHYGDTLFGIISKIVVDDGVAEEVLQDAFLEIWNTITLYDPTKGGLIAWMLNISRNLALKKAKSEGYKTDQGKNRHIFELNDVIEQKTGHTGVEGPMQGLSPDQKMIVELLYFKGYTQSEVATEFNLPLGKVKILLRSAIIHLKKTLT